MENMRILKPEELGDNPFELIGKEWLLLAAEREAQTNAMTVSWGGLGILWRKPVAFVFVRHSRYTLEFIEKADTFSLSAFDDPGHKLLGYFGSVSGRTEDKIAKSGLTQFSHDNTPCFEQSKLTIVCRKLFAQELLPESFTDRSILESCYSDHDYHRMYVGEVLSVLQRNQ